MKNESRASKKDVPCIYDFYEISCFTPNPQSLLKNVLARSVNCLVKAYNDAIVLLVLIVIILDWDLIQFVIKEFKKETNTQIPDNDIKMGISKALTWVINQFERATESKKDDMRCKKPGSIVVNQPKFLWVKMINRVNGNGKGYTLSFRPQYNADLESILADRTMGHLIADISQALMDANYFDRHNNLNAVGRVKFWEELDKLVEKLDKKSVHLRPTSTASTSTNFKTTHHARRDDHRESGTKRFFNSNKRRGSFRSRPMHHSHAPQRRYFNYY